MRTTNGTWASASTRFRLCWRWCWRWCVFVVHCGLINRRTIVWGTEKYNTGLYCCVVVLVILVVFWGSTVGPGMGHKNFISKVISFSHHFWSNLGWTSECAPLQPHLSAPLPHKCVSSIIHCFTPSPRTNGSNSDIKPLARLHGEERRDLSSRSSALTPCADALRPWRSRAEGFAHGERTAPGLTAAVSPGYRLIRLRALLLLAAVTRTGQKNRLTAL